MISGPGMPGVVDVKRASQCCNLIIVKEAFYVHPAISTKKRLEMDTAVKETEREVDAQKSW